MIEIAPYEYIKRMSFEDSKLYCFSLNIDGKIGWRLPTYVEYINIDGLGGWYDDDEWKHKVDKYYVTPVRDLKDD